MLIDFIAAISFFVIPYLTGRFFSKKIFQSYILGIFSWFLIYFVVFGITSLFKIDIFPIVIRVIAILISVGSVVHLIVKSIGKRPKIKLKEWGIGLFIVAFTAVIYFLIFKRNTPYPMMLNWDIYEHITLANLISEGKLSFTTSKISDTFTFPSYSPIFSFLLSIPKIVFNKALIGIYYFIEYFSYLLSVFASFLIAKRVFKESTTSVLAAIVSALTFESIMVYSGFFLIPQTFVALITVLILQEIMEYSNIKLLISFLTILLMHYVVGPLCVLILLVFYLVPRLFSWDAINRRLNLAIIITTILSIILIALNFLFKFNLVNSEEATHFNFSLFEKVDFFNQWYGLIFFVFFLIGFVTLFKQGNMGQKLVLTFATLILGLSLAPFSYFLKFYTLGHYFVNLVIVAGLSLFILNLSTVLRIIAILWITLVMAFVFYKNQLIYKEPLHFRSYDTQLSSEEIEAGKWLSTYEKEAFVISDPSLQYILEATSEVETQGGAYMDLDTRKKLTLIKGSYDTEFIKRQLVSINDKLVETPKKRLFVVGGRYFEWQNMSPSEKESSYFNIWAPKTMTNSDKAYVDFLISSPEFQLRFRNDQIVIFELI